MLFSTLICVICLAIAIPIGKLIWDTGAIAVISSQVITLAKLAPGILVSLWQAAFGGI